MAGAGLVDADGPINSNSSIGFEEDGTDTFSFSQPVTNLQFRINDFENELELVTIRLCDAGNNLISFNSQTGETVNGRDTDGALGSDMSEGEDDKDADDLDPDGSILVTVPGPVARIEIDFDSSGGTLALTDLVFDGETVVVGVEDDDVLFGGAGDDIIEGREGDDALAGGANNDILDGGTGDDTMTGGTGNDVFIETDGNGSDTILDFNAGNTGSIDDGTQSNNDFVDLSSFYNAAKVADVNDADTNPGNDFSNAIGMLRAGPASFTRPKAAIFRALCGLTPVIRIDVTL